jgi:hypothetical protein
MTSQAKYKVGEVIHYNIKHIDTGGKGFVGKILDVYEDYTLFYIIEVPKEKVLEGYGIHQGGTFIWRISEDKIIGLADEEPIEDRGCLKYL